MPREKERADAFRCWLRNARAEENASSKESLHELAFARMVGKGLADAREGRVVSDEEMGKRIRQWP